MSSWIKVRSHLLTHPHVVRIASALCLPCVHVLGALVHIWSVADLHADGEKLSGMTLESLDKLVETPNFGQQMIAVGWLRVLDDGLELVNYQAHNGSNAKRRASESRRKNAVRKMSASCPQNVRTRRGTNAHLERELDKEEEVKTEERSKVANPPTPTPDPKPAKPIKAKPDDVTGQRPELPPELDTPEVHAAWGCWLTTRKAKHRIPFPKHLAEKNIRKLAAWGLTKGLKILEQAAAGGWQALNDYETERAPLAQRPPFPATSTYQPKPPTPRFSERLAASQ